MRIVQYIAILWLVACQTSAQFNLEFHVGYGSYANQDLKKYQTSLMNSYLIGGKVLESFPGFGYYGVDAKWNLPASQIGLSLSQGSTGGQVYYADYSGTFQEQQLLKYKVARMLTALRFVFNNGNSAIQLDPRFGLAFGTLQVKRTINTTDGTETFNVNQFSRYKAVNSFCEPTLSISQKLGAFGVNIFVGYHADLAPDVYRESSGNPMRPNGNLIAMNLSGVRTGGSIGLYIKQSKEHDFTRAYVGIGTGLDFGGFGLNAMGMVTEQVGLFGGLGYNLNKIGMNGGVRLYANNQSARWRPYLSAMFGYNAVYVITDDHSYNKTFYGTTVGMGVDLRSSDTNFWTFALQFPIRGDVVNEYKNYLNHSNIEIRRDLLPVAISIGYRFAIVK